MIGPVRLSEVAPSMADSQAGWQPGRDIGSCVAAEHAYLSAQVCMTRLDF